MRKLSSNLQTVLALPEISYVYLVRIDAKGAPIYHTTAATNITTDVTYIPSSRLYSIEAPRLSSVVDRETYKIIYNDPDFSMRSMFEGILTNTPVKVTLCFINTTGGVLGSYADGDFMTGAADLIVAYGGVIDTHGYAVDPGEGTVFAALECSSPMASLGLSRPFMTSKDSMKQVNNLDTAFDQTFIGSKRIGLSWGKS